MPPRVEHHKAVGVVGDDREGICAGQLGSLSGKAIRPFACLTLAACQPSCSIAEQSTQPTSFRAAWYS
jgi:hypothetical protein